jgi:hypothetical protein
MPGQMCMCIYSLPYKTQQNKSYQILKSSDDGVYWIMDFIHRPVIEVIFFQWENSVGASPPHLRTEKNPVSKTLCIVVSGILDDGWSPKTQ